MSFRKLRSSTYAICFLFVLYCSTIRSCSAQNNGNNQSSCVPSSCGNIGSIRYPFRLKTDASHCGKAEPGFELSCRNNQTMMTFESSSLNVESISYTNYSIRLSDPGLVQEQCAYPNYNLNYIGLPYAFSMFKPGRFINDFSNLNNDVVFVNCLNVVDSPKYVLLNDTSCSRNSLRGYRYVSFGRMDVSDLEDSCSVDKVSWVALSGPSMEAGNTSLAGIRRSLSYGFELSWSTILCDNLCKPSRSTCIIIGYQASCKNYCFESTPYEEKSLACKLEFLAPAIIVYGGGGIAALLIVRFLLGLCCIGVLVRRERKRLHSWETKHMDDQVNAQEIPK